MCMHSWHATGIGISHPSRPFLSLNRLLGLCALVKKLPLVTSTLKIPAKNVVKNCASCTHSTADANTAVCPLENRKKATADVKGYAICANHLRESRDSTSGTLIYLPQTKIRFEVVHVEGIAMWKRQAVSLWAKKALLLLDKSPSSDWIVWMEQCPSGGKESKPRDGDVETTLSKLAFGNIEHLQSRRS
jgi:hypothetical protein